MSRNGHLPLCMATISPPHIRQAWDFERIVDPRKPCPLVGVTLQTMLPGDVRTVNGVVVRRGNNSKSKWWWVSGVQMSYADAVDALAGKQEAA